MTIFVDRERHLALAGATILPALPLLALVLPGAPAWFVLLAAGQGLPALLRMTASRHGRSGATLDLQVILAGITWGIGAGLFHDQITHSGNSLLPVFVGTMLGLGLVALNDSPRRQFLLLLGTGVSCAAAIAFHGKANLSGLGILSVSGGLVLLGQLGAMWRNRSLIAEIDGERRKTKLLLRRAREDLSLTVRDRTRELRETNERLNEEIETRQQSEDRIRYLLEHDPLTGLPNRLLLMRRLRDAIEEASKSDAVTAVMMLDLDGFKQVNDLYGHQAGDRLLRLASGRLSAVVSGTGTIARMGGDEFAIVVPEIEGSERAAELAACILQGFTSPFDIDGNNVHVLASIGVALAPENGTDAESLLLRADQSLYEAKSFGRGRFSMFSEELSTEQQNRSRLERELRLAIDAGQLHLCFQPRYTLSGQALVAVESLLRWRHPTLGTLVPGDFLPLAETTGLTTPIGRWVLKEASAHARLWQDSGLRTRIAVNMSLAQLNQHDIARQVLEALDQAGLGPERFEIEISEPVISAAGPGLVGQLQRIKGLGIHLVLDNFGTGATSLERIKSLPFDRLKIDRRFIRGMQSDPTDWAVVKSAITLARGMGWTSIAEGVEEEAQLDGLLALGCDEAQGFLLGQPMEIEDIRPVLGV
ncbi:MAG: EAL domain-containing protein [Geminicoccaceae bacterium]